MSDDRVSYMYQRDPSIDRRYRPRPHNVKDLFKDITEEEDCEINTRNGISLSSACSQSSSDTIDTTASVFLRLRPTKKLCAHYTAENNVLKVQPLQNITTNNKDLTEKHFEFSKIFTSGATQFDIYMQSVYSSVQNNDNLTILTYGTSGSGKTYTMYGTETEAGIVQRAIAHIFAIDSKSICKQPAFKVEKGNFLMLSAENIQMEQALTAGFLKEDSEEKHLRMIERIEAEHDMQRIESDWQFTFVWLSFAEIYNENVHDLLNPTANASKKKNLKIISNDGNSYIKDLTSVYVGSASNAFDVINSGLQQVNYASTNINANSSRSHCVLIVNVLHFSYPDSYSLATYKFCDLAGSERLKKTENTGSRLKEAQRINTSLMVLGRCFDLMYHNQQSKSKEVVPFRESKLTMMLQKSLLGQEKITTIVTMSPNLDFMEENLQVLNFASIAQQIVYKQPKSEPLGRRHARSTRFSLFMDAETNKHSDLNYILAENERLESEILDVCSERDKLREIIQQMNSDFSNREQLLRNKLVEEREAQMKTACEKYQKRIEFIEAKSKRRVKHNYFKYNSKY